MSQQRFKHISIGKDGAVWAIGKEDSTIYRLFGDAGMLGWVPDKQGKAEVLAAVDWGNLWCVNSAHEIWQLTDAWNLDEGGIWTKIPTHSGQADAETISVGSDGTVWYAQTDGAIIRQTRSGRGNRAWKWTRDEVGRAVVLAAVDRSAVYCINKEHQIWYGRNGAWHQIPTHSDKGDAVSIAVTPEGYAWYSGADGAVYRHVRPGDGVGLPLWWRASWERNGMGKATILSVGPDDLVWCLNTQGEVWRAYDGKWQQIVERGPNWGSWTYTVRRGEGLMAIVRREFGLKDPQDTEEIGRLVNLIVTQNGIKDPNSIKEGDVLTLQL